MQMVLLFSHQVTELEKLHKEPRCQIHWNTESNTAGLNKEFFLSPFGGGLSSFW